MGSSSENNAVCNSEDASTRVCTHESAHKSDLASACGSKHESTFSSEYDSVCTSEHCSHHGLKHGLSDSSRCFIAQGPQCSFAANSGFQYNSVPGDPSDSRGRNKGSFRGEPSNSSSQLPHHNSVEASCSYSDEPLDMQSLHGDGSSDEDVQPPKKFVRRQLFPPTNLSVDFLDFSEKVSVSAIILESIWNKASQLLSSSNAIAVAPGLDLKSHTVISTSGNRPHLVQAKKTGQYVCDKACGNWNSLSICSHTVAVSELNGELFKFVTWFVKAKKNPSVTKLVLTGMPEGRGRKGGKRPQPKKKALAVQTRTSIAELSGVTVTDATSSRSSASRGANLRMPSHPPPLVHVTPRSPSPISEPFVLCFVTGNISVCYGCRQKYQKPCQPPHDLCVRHKEWREFFAPGSATAQTRFGNVYYHCNTPCIQARCPFFTSDMLEVTALMAAQLLPAHTEYLATHMGRNA